MIHTLYREQIIPAPLAKVWEYFCDPKNLNQITPPDMNFEILRGGDVSMYEGQLIEYRVEFIRGFRSRWLQPGEGSRPRAVVRCLPAECPGCRRRPPGG